MTLIPSRPARLYNKRTEEVYTLPAGGRVELAQGDTAILTENDSNERKTVWVPME
jgi:hypothetical protein